MAEGIITDRLTAPSFSIYVQTRDSRPEEWIQWGNAVTDYQMKFQQVGSQRAVTLLRELFQFDCADLDFNIYRIMNYKRAVIEHFISGDLPKVIADELAQGAPAGQAQAAKELEAARKKVLAALGEDALDADGNLADKYRETKAGKEYLAAQERARSSKSAETLETAIYNHLYAFFSRYWQDGDFISNRCYSKEEHYTIPYNGEEVTLYWANPDQCYAKTGEYFTDYTWKAPNWESKRSETLLNVEKLQGPFFYKRISAPVETFEGRNLIFVDEGHKGSGGEAWRKYRDALGPTGFTSEYSAAFGQALSTAGNDKPTAEYGKAIVFGYSYRYFYGDGKDFRILNLRDETDEEKVDAVYRHRREQWDGTNAMTMGRGTGRNSPRSTSSSRNAGRHTTT